MNGSHYPVQLAARLTGLTTHAIRIWEQRYRAVEPVRTVTNRRLYSQADIDRLSMLRELTHAGHSIGQIANLPTEELSKLCRESTRKKNRAADVEPQLPEPDVFYLECIAAVRALDNYALEAALRRGAGRMGSLAFLQRVLVPLAESLGELWRDGSITVAHEHMATAAIRSFLGTNARSFGSLENAPTVMVATPAGQVHEIGALLVASVAGHVGWKVVYLGASVPSTDLAAAAQQLKPRAVALSVVYPEDDRDLVKQLEILHQGLPSETALLVGGRAMPAYREELGRIGALMITSLSELGAALDRLRKPLDWDGSVKTAISTTLPSSL